MTGHIGLIRNLFVFIFAVAVSSAAWGQQVLTPQNLQQPGAQAVPNQPTAAPLPHEGFWRTSNQLSEMEVYQCGLNIWCTKIVWLQEPLNEQGLPKVDHRNPDQFLRTRQLVGMNIMTGLAPEPKKPSKLKGRVYNPRNGKQYLVFIEPVSGGNTMKITGCLMFPLCKSENWTRVEKRHEPQVQLQPRS